MGMIKLERHTSTEADLFEFFAKFLTRLKYKEFSVDDFRNYVGELLSDKENGLAALSGESVKRYFIRTFECAEIDEDRFNAFCNKFEKIYDDLASEQRRKYERIKRSFDNWKQNIFRESGRLGEDVRQESNQDRILNDTDAKKGKVDSIERAEFEKLMDEIDLAYETYGFYSIEWTLFQEWKDLVRDRLKITEDFNSEQIKAMLTIASDYFDSTSWEVYEQNESHVTKAAVYIIGCEVNNLRDDVTDQKSDYVVGVATYPKNEENIYFDGRFLFSVFPQQIELMFDRKDGEQSEMVGQVGYFFPYFGKNISPDYCEGYSVRNPFNGEKKIRPVVIRKVNRSEFDKTEDVVVKLANDSDELPKYIKKYFMKYDSLLEQRAGRFLLGTIGFNF